MTPLATQLVVSLVAAAPLCALAAPAGAAAALAAPMCAAAALAAGMPAVGPLNAPEALDTDDECSAAGARSDPQCATSALQLKAIAKHGGAQPVDGSDVASADAAPASGAPASGAPAGGEPDSGEEQPDAAVATGEDAAAANGAYNQQEAVECAYMSAAAYCQGELAGWSCGKACNSLAGMTQVRPVNERGAHFYVGLLRGQCTLVFRGTDDYTSTIEDLKSAVVTEFPGCSHGGEPCGVALGFWRSYQKLAPHIEPSLAAIGCGKSSGLRVTGHSLGAAQAAIAVYDLKRKGWELKTTYTFGQPRVGDRVFAAAFDQAVGRGEFYRVTHGKDPIVQLPFVGFYHVATEVFYPGAATEGYHICGGSGEDPSCSLQYGRSLWAVIRLGFQCLANIADSDGGNVCGHVTYMTPLLGTEIWSDACPRKTLIANVTNASAAEAAS